MVTLRRSLVSAGLLLVAATAQDFHEFQPTGSVPPLLVDWRAVAAGDIDGDGDLDLVLANFGTPGQGQRNLWLRNDGTGLFARMPAAALRLAPSLSRAVVLGDFDRDGDLDAFFGNQRLDALCRNDGAGELALAPAALPPVDRDTWAAAAGDVDGDGDLDLVAACGGYDVLYRNDGTGTFTDASGQLPAAWDLTVALDLGDFDGDGDLDLLRINEDGPSQLLWNDGSGTFAPAALSLPTGSWVSGGDVDGDGDRDFVLGLYNAPSGPFGPSYGIAVYRNQGAGNFAAETLGASNPRLPSPGRLADLDGDGDLDLAIAGVGVLRNSGTGTFAAADRQTWIGRDFADIDGDGDLDQIGLPTLRNDGSGGFPIPDHLRPVLTANHERTVALLDFDGDGDLDLAEGGLFDLRVVANDGRGAYRGVLAQAPNNAWSSEPWPVADWTGDGRPDLLAAFAGTLFVNVGGAALQPVALPEALSQVLALDADGDGDQDLVGVRFTGAAVWFRNLGAGTFAAGAALPIGGVSSLLASVDVDGDGRQDVLWANFAGQPAVLRTSGNGAFTALPGALPAGLPPTVAATAADLDGDLDLDLVLGHDFRAGAAARTTMLRNTGGSFAAAGSLPLPTSIDTVASLLAFDADLDGDLDLVVGPFSASGQAARLLRHDGAFSFVDATGTGELWRGLRAPAGGSLLAGDVDGDGDGDLLVAGTARTHVLQNLHRQLVVGEHPPLGGRWRLEVLQRPIGTGAGGVLVGIAELQPPQATPFGPLRIDPQFASGVGFVPVPNASPVEVTALPIPNVPALRGLLLFAQHVAFDGTTIRLGNAVRGVVH